VLGVSAGGIGDRTHAHQQTGSGLGGDQINTFPLPPDVVLFGLFDQFFNIALKFSHRDLLSEINGCLVSPHIAFKVTGILFSHFLAIKESWAVKKQ
jgi:hypothetical protein